MTNQKPTSQEELKELHDAIEVLGKQIAEKIDNFFREIGLIKGEKNE